ncbi:MAG TPA: menaquinone biosynthesis protein [Spirochaetota bacterium]|nr:menaquinone biosynthesis protein [Spirochaetota bacterium]HPR38654.1 menaquinone biosynthesis protein [Spirochaetota bacterium]
MNIGYINYLNCFPFYYHMFEVEPVEGVKVVPAYPGELNRLVKNHELQMSPVSAAAYTYLQGDYVILPGFCLSSVGYVKSVVLQSRVPIEELDGKRVGLTTASETSVALLKILLAKYYKVNPEYIPVKPRPDFADVDAALVIGNEAMMEPAVPVEYSYDLGDLWLRKTGYPVVFAIFVAQKETVENEAPLLRDICRSYRTSLKVLKNERELLVGRASEMYPDISYDISRYYSYLRFEFTDELKDALAFYFKEAFEAGILAEVKELEFAKL